MSPRQRHASFVVRLWYAGDSAAEGSASEPLRGQIIHVQSDDSGSIQKLEEVTRFIAGHLSGPNVRNAAGTATERLENSTEETVVGKSGGKDDV